MTLRFAIFRIPDDENGMCFAQMSVEEGVPDPECQIFGILPGDTYAEVNFGQLIIAEPIMGGSHETARYSIGSGGEDGGPPTELAVIHEMEWDGLKAIITHLVEITPRPTDLDPDKHVGVQTVQ